MDRFYFKELAAGCYDGFPATGRPVIGITANYGEQTAKLAEGYYKQVLRAGGTPFIIPPDSNREVLFSTLDCIDALLLTGGADINPLYQGQEPKKQLGNINAERDLPELLITRLAFNRQMPILGICRGIQTMAIALGGEVAQDISTSFEQSHIKHSQDADRHVPTHTAGLYPDTLLYKIISQGSTISRSYAVNSFHHQAVIEPGPHFRVSAIAPDGIIEAIESSERKPMLGVQWHPECLGDDGLPLFQWLVSEASLYQKAQRLHDSILTLDTHCDTPMFFPKIPAKTVENRGQDPVKTVENHGQDPVKTVENRGLNFAIRNSRILVDLPKMTEGRLDATIMVAYIPQKMEESAFAYANSIFDQIGAIVSDNAAHLALARTPDDLWRNKLAGKKSIMLGIENGKALEGSLQNIQHFKNRGIVYITLCHNGDNDICDSAKGEQTHGGVSPFGVEVIHEMNRLGLMVDLSHAHEKSFYDALDISTTPIVCSHSSCRALCDHPRNLTDDQMRALAAKGGVCQITLYPGFLRTDDKATIIDAMKHLDHAIQVMGIDHVGLGTDFDGDGGVPGLADASELVNFTRQLLQRHYNAEDVQKIWGGNFLRVMKQVQRTMNNVH